MAASLFGLMRPEIEKYVEEREKKHNRNQAVIMIRHGDDNDYIKLLTHLSDDEIDELRKNPQSNS